MKPDVQTAAAFEARRAIAIRASRKRDSRVHRTCEVGDVSCHRRRCLEAWILYFSNDTFILMVISPLTQ